MSLHKTRPSASRPCAGSSTGLASGQNQLSRQTSTNTDKSNEAAQMAQHLASQASWADTYVPATPATDATPPESVVDTQSVMSDATEPPPSYEDARLQRDLPPVPAGTQDNALKGFGIGFWRTDGSLIPPLPQRDYTRHETTSSITGTFTFHDSLSLSTTSGAINIVIDPQISNKVGILNITSNTGSIKVKFSEDYMKGLAASGNSDRIYNITVRSSTGSQSLELPQVNGGLVSLTSETGTIAAKLYMAQRGNETTVTKLVTESTHGTQSIKVKSTSPDRITTLSAQLRTKNSGSVKLNLPTTWEGMVHAVSGGSGNVDVKGDNLQYQRNGVKEIYAWRVQSEDSKEPKRQGHIIEIEGGGSGSIKVDCSTS